MIYIRVLYIKNESKKCMMLILNFFLGPFAAALVNKFGYRIVGIIGTVLASASTAVSVLCNNLTTISLLYGIIGGIGFGMIYMTAVVAVGFYFERWRSLATGISTCGAGIGCIILPLAFTMAVDCLGWRTSFIIQASLIILCGICALIFKPLNSVLTANTSCLKLEEKTSDQASRVKFAFFERYHNSSFPTVAEVKSSTETILRPQTLERSGSSEISFNPSASKHSRKESSFHTPKALSSVRETKSEIGFYKKCLKCFKLQRFFKEDNKCSEKKNGICKNDRCRSSISARPFYRDDIFYHGSMYLIPEYRKSMQSKATSTVIILLFSRICTFCKNSN